MFIFFYFSGDVENIKNNMNFDYYEAFLFYTNADEALAKNILLNLEEEAFPFKLCDKNRDIINFKPTITMLDLIKKRCTIFIIILSNNFISSIEDTSFKLYTQTIKSKNIQNKIIFCSYNDNNNCLHELTNYFPIITYENYGAYFYKEIASPISRTTGHVL